MRDEALRGAVAAVVLAGGRGTRMGGVDKGLQALDGRPLAQHVLEALRPQVAEVCISANRHAEAYRALGAEVIADAWPDFRGPLAGLHAALARGTHDWWLAAPCDTPGLPADLVARLHGAARARGRPAAYAVVRGEPVYPLCLVQQGCFDDLQRALRDGQYAVGRWLAGQGAVAVDIDGWDARLPLNLNTPQRLAAAQSARP